jgi:hypothetical protein
MPKARDPNLPQINGQLIYGAISIETFPNGTAVGQIPYWDGVQWQLVTFVGAGGVDVTYNAGEKTLEIIHVDNRIASGFTADAIIQGTVTKPIWADAQLAGIFTADAELV